MREKTFQIPWEGSEREVTITELKYGDTLKLRKKYRKYVTKNGKPELELDEESFNLDRIILCIKSSPFDNEVGAFKELPTAVMEKIEFEVNEINTLSVGEKNSTDNGDKTRLDNQTTSSGDIQLPQTSQGDRNETLGSGQDGNNDV